MVKTKIKLIRVLIILVLIILSISIAAAVRVLLIYVTSSRLSNSRDVEVRLNEAQQAFNWILKENNGEFIDSTYVSILDGETEYWFNYNNGVASITSSHPNFDWTFCSITYKNQDSKDVTIKTPIVKLTEDKINSNLTNDSETTFVGIADACKSLSNLYTLALSSSSDDYQFVYSLGKNTVLIVNKENTKILYANSDIEEIPADSKKILIKNCENSKDLVDFSNISNIHDETSKLAIEDNIYLYNKPIVIVNLNKDIDIAESTETFIPIANWDTFGKSNWQAIQIILNGNGKKITGLRDALIGCMETGSIIRDVTLSYTIGSEENRMSKSATVNNVTKNIFHFGVVSKTIASIKAGKINTYDNILLEDIKLTGQVYLSNKYQQMNVTAVMIGVVANATATGDVKLITFKDCDLFTSDGDYFGFDLDEKEPQVFALLIGNPEKNQFEWDNITYSETNIIGLANNDSRYPDGIPYLGIIA